MKKIITMLCSMALIIVLAGAMTQTANAETISDTDTESGYVDVDENGNYYYVSPFEYGEIKDGLFVRTYFEEIASIAFLNCDEYSDLYDEECRKIDEARMLDEMTPEMIEDGGYYQSRPGGFVTMQADIDYSSATYTSEGDAGEGSNVMDFDEATDPCGYVTIIAEVDPVIEETGTTCFIRLENLDTGEWTEIAELLPVNHYTKTGWKLPVGTYRVAAGGIYEDYKIEYPLVDLTGDFILQDGGSAQVCVTIGNVSGTKAEESESIIAETSPEVGDEPETTTVETIAETETGSATESVAESEDATIINETEEAVEAENDSGSGIGSVILIIIVVIIIIAAFIIVRRRSGGK